MTTAIPVGTDDSPQATEVTMILVPIRYPITAQGAKTLTRARELSDETDVAHIIVLHINLFQRTSHVTRRDVWEAIRPVLKGQPFDVTIRRGALIESIVLEEVQRHGADIIVIGANQKATWRKFLSRLLGNDPDLPSYLRTHTDVDIEIVG